MATLRRLRISDRATGTVLAELDAATQAPTGDPPDSLALVTEADGGGVEVVVDGWRFDLVVDDADRADLRIRATRGRRAQGRDGPTDVRAIIPGRVVSVAVGPGDAVTAGTRLLAVEAMKMENEVRAPRDATVERVAVAAGETVDLGDLLVVLR